MMNTRSPEIRHYSMVSMHFSLALEDGTEAITTFNEEPLEFQMGDGTLQPGLELGLFGLRAGDKQTLTLTPEQGYGWHDDKMIHHMSRTDFADKLEPQPGQVIAFTTDAGEEAPGIVLSVDNQQVAVDFNHPLAGHNLLYKVEILAVQDGEQPD